jgi:hypothetical protein
MNYYQVASKRKDGSGRHFQKQLPEKSGGCEPQTPVASTQEAAKPPR